MIREYVAEDLEIQMLVLTKTRQRQSKLRCQVTRENHDVGLYPTLPRDEEPPNTDVGFWWADLSAAMSKLKILEVESRCL